MTTVHSAHTSSSFSFLFEAIKGFPRRLRERREMNALLHYDEYMLHDIGVSRDGIARGASRSLWHD